MVALRRFLSVAAPLTVVLALVCASFAQDASSDQAKNLLEKGIAQYKALEFKAAKEILLSVERSKLPPDGQKNLDTYLNQVDGAIKQQAAANEAFNAAEKALAKNDLAKAREGYAAAAGSEFLQPQMRKDAKAQLALVDDRIKLQSATTPPPPVKTTPPPVTTTQPAPANPPVKTAPPPHPAAPVPPVHENPMLTRVEKQKALAQQEANLQFQKHMMEVSEHLIGAESDKDFDAAASACREAREVLESNKDVYANDQYRVKMAKVEDQMTYIDQQRTKWNETQTAQKKAEIEAAKIKRERETRERRRMDIERLTHEAKVLIKQHQYGKAVEVMQQIKVLDPNNEWIQENEDVYKELTMLRERREFDNEYQENVQRQHNSIAESEIPWWQMLLYPKDWRELTVSREKFAVTSATSSESDRAVAAKLHMRIPKLDFDDTEFSSVITFLRETSGVNINPNWTALDAAGLGGGNSKTAKVSVHLTDVTFEKALGVILSNLGGGATQLSYMVDEGVVTISTKEDLSQKAIARVYDISDLLVRVPMLPGPVLDLSQSTPEASNGGGGGSSGSGGIFGSCSSTTNTTADNNPTRQQMIEAIENTITNSVEPESWKPNGQVGCISPFGGNLVILQTADAHTKISNVLAQLRETRAIQINIEARFVEVDSGFLESIGLDLNFYFNLGSHTSTQTVIDPFTGVPVTTTVTAPAQTIQVGNSTGTVLSRSTTPGVAPSTTFTQAWGGSNPASISSAVSAPSMQVSGAFLDDIQVAFLLQATQANSTTRTLTAPHLTLFNGQRAYVTVGQQFAYVSNFIPVVSENTASAAPIVSWIPTGSVLDVEATVTADRRYVTMTIRPQVSELIGTPRQVTVAGSTIELPNVKIKKLETTVNVPDGGTLLLGGQKADTVQENQQGVPLLSKIPIINRLFTNTGTVKDESTLLILVKPKIMIMQEEEAKAFP